ncbi:MAG: alpha/beta hydrolase [Desulfovibrio sp.]|uniref:alpha/beta hydrolase n=1 Tax=Desulfovibrio sp. TaxID=885 RepID=UPI0039E37C02
MNILKKNLFTLLLLSLWVSSSQAAMRELPAPNTVSPEMQKLTEAAPLPFWNLHPKDHAEWKSFVQSVAEATATELPGLREQMEVTVTPGSIAGVPVFTVTPRKIRPENSERILLHLHGGGYVLNPGETGTYEAILMAGMGGFKVLSVDYRMAPDFPYPAAMDDAVAVYRELLKTVPAEKIGVFGTSTGGGMTLALGLRAKAEGLPLPAALAPGTPWTDLTQTGDSYFVNEGVDNILVSYDGWLGEAAKVYANGHDMKDPMLSPIYGDVSGFPPTLLTTGTRDLFLSNTIRMHLKLRQAGIDADLIVFEGMSHAHYLMDPNAPETRFHFTELKKFFNQHLQ